MANDSPAKSLVDIDLASLRVSAAEPSRCFFFNVLNLYIYIYFFLFSLLWFLFNPPSFSVTCSSSKFEPALLVRDEVLKMTAEP